MATTRPGFLRLPVEIQQEIVGYFTSKADLKSLCLTCKELQSVANPLLYQSIVLGTSQLGSALKRALHDANPGLRYVRSLRVYEYPEAYHHKAHGDALCHVLQALPKDALTFFELDTYKGVSLDMVFLLRTRQRCLANYQEQSLMPSSKARIVPDKADLQLITSIQLYLCSRKGCARAGQLLRHATHVKHLDIAAAGDVDLGNDNRGADHYELLDCLLTPSTVDGLDASKSRLERLTLQDLDLQLAGDLKWGDVLGSVRELVVKDCEAVDILLNEWHFPAMRSAKVARAANYGQRPSAMTEFLEQANGLEELQIGQVYVEEDCGFDWASLGPHAKSLRLLSLDESATPDWPFVNGLYDRSYEALGQLYRSCSKLQQLALVMPKPGRETWERADGLIAFLECLKHLKALKTLRLFALLDDPDTGRKQTASTSRSMEKAHKSDMHDMQDLANKIFDELAPSCPHLAGLVIDARKPGEDCRSRDVRQFGFLRARQIDLCGRTKTVGIAIEPHMIKHHEPCSEIFEDGLGPV